MAGLNNARRKWQRVYKEAIEFDTWGQVEEATENYLRLNNFMKNELTEGELGLTQPQTKQVQKMCHCLSVRVKELQAGKELGIGLRSMKVLDEYMQSSFLVSEQAFPLHVMEEKIPERVAVIGDEVQEQEGGSLLPPSTSQRRGDEFLAIKLEKWGFKDASGYIDPFVTVSVVDETGKLIESSQDTPITKSHKPNYVMLEHTVHIQTALNALPNKAAIVIEFKHYKPKKKKVSTKAWCFFQQDEIKEGGLVCEIYNKPTDFRRKKLSLMTVKQLYVHMHLSIRKVTD